MAPEQAAGHRRSIGPGTDVYGLGAILYELLTGRPPFRTPTMMETVVQVLERDPVPPRELARGLPHELETICLKCLEKMPEDRYPSAQALADDLERFLQGDPVEATGIFQSLRRWTRREPEVVSRLGGLAVVAVITEFNHWVFSPNANHGIHYQVQGTLLLWAVSAFVFQFLWRRGWRSDLIRMLWSSADLIFLTIALKLLNRPESTLLVGYPLMIAASGLWFRVGLVWFTTALAIVGYLVIYCGAAFDWSQPFPTWAKRDDLQYPNIFIACLLLTGFVVARQVKRILALGSSTTRTARASEPGLGLPPNQRGHTMNVKTTDHAEDHHRRPADRGRHPRVQVRGLHRRRQPAQRRRARAAPEHRRGGRAGSRRGPRVPPLRGRRQAAGRSGGRRGLRFHRPPDGGRRQGPRPLPQREPRHGPGADPAGAGPGLECRGSHRQGARDGPSGRWAAQDDGRELPAWAELT